MCDWKGRVKASSELSKLGWREMIASKCSCHDGGKMRKEANDQKEGAPRVAFWVTKRPHQEWIKDGQEVTHVGLH